jgi:hypothetical protein
MECGEFLFWSASFESVAWFVYRSWLEGYEDILSKTYTEYCAKKIDSASDIIVTDSSWQDLRKGIILSLSVMTMQNRTVPNLTRSLKPWF